MAFFRKVSPTGAVKDFAAVWTSNPHRWPVLLVAILATTTIMAVAIPKSVRVPPAKPRITYVTTFDDHRSNAEIIASNIANQKQQDVLRAEEAKREEFRKDMYRKLGRATGIDVDKMERDIKAEEAAEQAAAKAKAKAAGAAAQAVAPK